MFVCVTTWCVYATPWCVCVYGFCWLFYWEAGPNDDPYVNVKLNTYDVLFFIYLFYLFILCLNFDNDR